MYTNTGCKRLVDYYFVVSCSDHGKEQTKRRLCHQSLARQHEKEARHALFALKPKIVDRYPTRDYSDTPLLPWVARASMPRGVRARTIPPAPRYFTFTGWNIDGSKLYGACLEVFEKMDIKKQRQPVYIPKTLGFISHYPYFYAFDVFLRCLWHVIPKKLIRLEDLLMHYFYDIPAPLPRKKIAYDLGKMKVLLACRNEFDVPIMELPIETPFTQLSKDRICMIIKLLLLEHRIVFVCTLVHELTPVCELFASLLFPLRWRHLFIPLVCRPMAEALKKMAEYEYPFLVGMPRFVYVRPEISSSMPHNTYIVFLDRNEITDEKKQSIPSSCIPNLPSPLEENLKDSIHALARVLTMPDGTVSRDVILQAFRTMFAVITKLLFIAANIENIENNTENIHGSSRKSKSFVSLFRETNLFKSFKKYYHRINPNDPQLKSIYPFFKENEALGKHFARRSHSNSWSAGFDQSQYSRDAFRVNQDVIKRVEKQFAKKRADLAASNRNTKFSLPKEFEHLPQVKEFLQQYVFFNNNNSGNKVVNGKNNNNGSNNNNNNVNNAAKQLKNNNMSNTNNNDKKTPNKRMNAKKSKKSSKKSLKKSINNKNNSNNNKNVHKTTKNNTTQEKTSTATKKQTKTKTIQKTKIKTKPKAKTAAAIKPKDSGEMNENKAKNENDKKRNTEREKQEKIDAIENEEEEEESDSSSDYISDSEDEDTDSDSEDGDDSESESDDDSSHWSDDDDWSDEDDWRLNEEAQTDLRRNSAAAVRHNRRFQNLNEFELTPKEKQWFVNCQKQHNSLIANVPDKIKPIIAKDLFDDNIVKSWQTFKHKKIHKTYKKPKGS